MILFVVGIYMRAGMRSIIIWVVVVFVVMFVVLFATPRISFPASKHLSSAVYSQRTSPRPLTMKPVLRTCGIESPMEARRAVLFVLRLFSDFDPVGAPSKHFRSL